MRPIDAEALKTRIQKIEAEALEHGFAPEYVCVDLFLDFLDNAPTIEAKPVVHAHWEWVKIEDGDSYFELAECSNCRGQSVREYPYCRHCGAQMDAEVGVKIPVIKMSDVPKIAKEMEEEVCYGGTVEIKNIILDEEALEKAKEEGIKGVIREICIDDIPE